LGYFRHGDGIHSSVSLKSRIREAQRAAAKRMKPGPPRQMPTVDEIRAALLRKSANGKKPQ